MHCLDVLYQFLHIHLAVNITWTVIVTTFIIPRNT
jgi:hypothetical protein